MLKPAYIASLLIVIILLGHLNFSVYAQDSPLITKIGPLLANENKSTSISNPEFTLFNNISGLVAYGLGPFWKDIFGYCKTSFECVSDNTTGWMDNSSLKVSTRGDNSKNKGTSNWSWIYGNELSVNPGERYEVVTHMKLNEYAVQSHVALEGYNQTSQVWNQIAHCPSGTSGPLFEWSMFSCDVLIPEGISQVRVILNAGWSLSNNRAVTWFDEIHMNIPPSVKSEDEMPDEPSLTDKNLKLDTIYDQLDTPTSITFLGKDDFLVSERNSGLIYRVINGVRLEQPLIDLNVSSIDGVLGLALSGSATNNKGHENAYVFVYYDENTAGDCECPPIASRLYRYDLVNNGTQLLNPKLLISLPIGNTYPLLHEGGVVKIGPDGNVYLVVGDLRSIPETGNIVKSKAVNYIDGIDPDGRAGILRFNIHGEPVNQKGILGDTYPLNLYYAYGIRNSFGFAFDPVTGKLWDTENGPNYGDEINLVEPGFNSGWGMFMGNKRVVEDPVLLNAEHPSSLVTFNLTGEYSDPEFVWQNPVAPTSISFVNSSSFGEVYRNDLLVADYLGNIYHFDLNVDRTRLLLRGPLNDTVANTSAETDGVRFGQNFGIITDMQIGPDGDLYIVSMSLGKIFRVSPA